MAPGCPVSLLAVVIGSVFLASIGFGLSRLALAKYLRDDLGASALVVSSLTSWFMGARAFSSILSGIAADTLPSARRMLMILPLGLTAVIVYTIPSLESPIAILFLNALWGFLSGAVWPVVQTAAAMLAGPWSSTVMSVYFASGSLGTTAGQYLYGVLTVDNPGAVRLSALFFASSAAMLAYVSHAAPAAGIRGRRRSRSGLKAVLGTLRRDRFASWILLSALAAGYLSGLLREFLYVYLGEVYGLDRQELASTLALADLAAFAVGLAVGQLADRLGVAPVIAAVLATGLAGSLALGLSTSLPVAMIGLALALTATRSSLPLTRNAAAFSAEYRATLVGASNTLSNIGHLASPIIAGKLYDTLYGSTIAGIRGEATPFLTAAILLAPTLALYPVCVRTKQYTRPVDRV
ncbi:conserved archaeal protein [Hyperthermus butylicus DSM 5456]|uniref:Conserved archaeal protein n=1 Tax=Hyperthermus butylicus (strain DSM 5456 / JCM 9403 / PLM1-5) TaxID=415426 RepID=A2BML5_HYPBU|nr:conserved archaeal protein [Hyperthermus butylicus DSM 5456]